MCRKFVPPDTCKTLSVGARELCGHLEKCIALSDVYNYKQTHCFVLVNKN